MDNNFPGDYFSFLELGSNSSCAEYVSNSLDNFKHYYEENGEEIFVSLKNGMKKLNDFFHDRVLGFCREYNIINNDENEKLSNFLLTDDITPL